MFGALNFAEIINAKKVCVNVCNLGAKLLNGAVHCIEIMNVSQLVGYGTRWVLEAGPVPGNSNNSGWG